MSDREPRDIPPSMCKDGKVTCKSDSDKRPRLEKRFDTLFVAKYADDFYAIMERLTTDNLSWWVKFAEEEYEWSDSNAIVIGKDGKESSFPLNHLAKGNMCFLDVVRKYANRNRQYIRDPHEVWICYASIKDWESVDKRKRSDVDMFSASCRPGTRDSPHIWALLDRFNPRRRCTPIPRHVPNTITSLCTCTHLRHV